MVQLFGYAYVNMVQIIIIVFVLFGHFSTVFCLCFFFCHQNVIFVLFSTFSINIPVFLRFCLDLILDVMPPSDYRIITTSHHMICYGFIFFI